MQGKLIRAPILPTFLEDLRPISMKSPRPPRTNFPHFSPMFKEYIRSKLSQMRFTSPVEEYLTPLTKLVINAIRIIYFLTHIFVSFLSQIVQPHHLRQMLSTFATSQDFYRKLNFENFLYLFLFNNIKLVSCILSPHFLYRVFS